MPSLWPFLVTSKEKMSRLVPLSNSPTRTKWMRTTHAITANDQVRASMITTNGIVGLVAKLRFMVPNSKTIKMTMQNITQLNIYSDLSTILDMSYGP